MNQVPNKPHTLELYLDRIDDRVRPEIEEKGKSMKNNKNQLHGFLFDQNLFSQYNRNIV